MTAIGFAAVYIAGKSQISAGSLTYAVFFFAVYLAAHLVARYAVPNADPYVLPIAALLTAVGLTEIYRLGPSDAFLRTYNVQGPVTIAPRQTSERPSLIQKVGARLQRVNICRNHMSASRPFRSQ